MAGVIQRHQCESHQFWRTVCSPRVYKWLIHRQGALYEILYLNPMEAHFLSRFSQSLSVIFHIAAALNTI